MCFISSPFSTWLACPAAPAPTSSLLTSVFKNNPKVEEAQLNSHKKNNFNKFKFPRRGLLVDRSPLLEAAL